MSITSPFWKGNICKAFCSGLAQCSVSNSVTAAIADGDGGGSDGGGGSGDGVGGGGGVHSLTNWKTSPNDQYWNPRASMDLSD